MLEKCAISLLYLRKSYIEDVALLVLNPPVFPYAFSGLLGGGGICTYRVAAAGSMSRRWHLEPNTDD